MVSTSWHRGRCRGSLWGPDEKRRMWGFSRLWPPEQSWQMPRWGSNFLCAAASAASCGIDNTEAGRTRRPPPSWNSAANPDGILKGADAQIQIRRADTTRNPGRHSRLTATVSWIQNTRPAFNISCSRHLPLHIYWRGGGLWKWGALHHQQTLLGVHRFHQLASVQSPAWPVDLQGRIWNGNVPLFHGFLCSCISSTPQRQAYLIHGNQSTFDPWLIFSLTLQADKRLKRL